MGSKKNKATRQSRKSSRIFGEMENALKRLEGRTDSEVPNCLSKDQIFASVVEIDRSLDALKNWAESGDDRSLDVLFRISYQSTVALNTLRDSAILKRIARQISVWPLLDCPAKPVREQNAAYLRGIELGRECVGPNAAKMLDRETPFRKHTFHLLEMVHQIRHQTIRGRRLAKSIPTELLAQIEKLPELTKQTKSAWGSTIRSLLVHLSHNQFEKIPDLRKAVEHLSTRKGGEKGSPEALKLVRADIVKRLKEALDVVVSVQP